MIFAIIALLLANVSTARAEENFGFSIAGVEVSDENCDVIGKVLSWSNFLLSGEVTYNRATNTLTLDNADIRFPFGRSGIRNDSCPDLTIVVKGACKLQNAMFDSGYYHIVVERATHVVGTHADTLYMEGGLGLCTRANLSKLSYDGDSNLYLDSLTFDIDLHWAHCFSAYDGAKKKADVNNDGAIDSADIVAVIKAMK